MKNRLCAVEDETEMTEAEFDKLFAEGKPAPLVGAGNEQPAHILDADEVDRLLAELEEEED